MTKSIRIDAEADDEISHAIDRYEREREGLGAEFWDELKAAMRTLEAPGPECGPVIGLPRELGVRRKLLARFSTRSSSWKAIRSSGSFRSCMVIGVPLTGVVVSERSGCVAIGPSATSAVKPRSATGKCRKSRSSTTRRSTTRSRRESLMRDHPSDAVDETDPCRARRNGARRLARAEDRRSW